MKPQIQEVDRTKAVWQSSTTPYNSASVTYSSSSTRYGGADLFSDVSTQVLDIELNKPFLFQPIDNKPKIDGVTVL